MIDNEVASLLLSELDGIANAPMTASQREVRAGPLLAESGVTVDDLTRALARRHLRWNQRKAEERGGTIEEREGAGGGGAHSPGRGGAFGGRQEFPCRRHQGGGRGREPRPAPGEAGDSRGGRQGEAG